MIALPPNGLALAERAELAAVIRDRLAGLHGGDETVHVLYEPGDATHYELILTRLGQHPFVGATYAPQYPLSTTLGVRAVDLLLGCWFVLSWPETAKAMVVNLADGHYTDPTYVSEKMGIGLVSGAVIAELLNMVAGVDEPTLEAMRQTHSIAFEEYRLRAVTE